MTAGELKSALATEPFQPFRLHFGSDKTLDIVNPGLVVVSDTGRTAVALRSREEGFGVIDVMLIERIESPIRSAENGRNGAPPARQ